MSSLRVFSEATYPTVKALYQARGGERSGELDFGVWWFNGGRPDRGPRFRVSAIHETGDVYAVNLMSGQTELLAHVITTCFQAGGQTNGRLPRHSSHCVYTITEALFEGWSAGGPKPLAWIKERLQGATSSPPATGSGVGEVPTSTRPGIAGSGRQD